MARPVRRHPDFEADYRALLRNLVARDERDWILNLANGLEEVVQMLSIFPAAGPRIAERGTVQLRKLIFRKGPYVAWYLYDAGNSEADVWLVRLFYARQKRPAPRLGRWVRRGRMAQ